MAATDHPLKRLGSLFIDDFATWMADLALGMGETERALEAALIAFRGAPELAAYQKVQELAGQRYVRDSWPTCVRAARLSRQGQSRSSCTRG